jgi:hypothetical protein
MSDHPDLPTVTFADGIQATTTSKGTLFFFNTSKEQWRALGGEMGYAIILKGRIVWKRRLKIS